MPSTRQSNAKAYDRVTSGSRPSNGQQSQFGFDASFLTQFLNNEKVRDTDIRELWIEEPRVVRQLVVWRRRCFDSDEHRTWLTQNGQYKLEERRLPSFIQEIGEYVANTPTTRLKFEPDPDLDHDTPYSRAHEFKQMWGYTAYQIANNSSRVSVFREARQSEKGDRNLGTESNVHFTRWCYEQAAALIMSCFQDLNQHSDGYFKRLLDAWTGPGPTTNNDSPISWDKVDSDGPKRTITGTPSSIKRTYSERYPNSSAITPTKPPSSSRRTSTRPPSLSEGDSDGDNEIRQKRQRGSEAQQDMLHPGVAISEANVLSSIESDTSSSLFNGQNASNASTVVVVEPESGTLESSVPRQETINAYQTPEQDSDAKPSTGM